MENRIPSKWALRGFLIGAGVTTFIYILMRGPIGSWGSGDNWGFRDLVGLLYLPFMLPTALVFRFFGIPAGIGSFQEISFRLFCANALINGTLLALSSWMLAMAARKFDSANRK
jgi:hypothetical protein